MDYHTAGGARLEGRGLNPDVSVEPTREDLRRRRDRALEMALEILKTEDGGESAAGAAVGVRVF